MLTRLRIVTRFFHPQTWKVRTEGEKEKSFLNLSEYSAENPRWPNRIYDTANYVRSAFRLGLGLGFWLNGHRRRLGVFSPKSIQIRASWVWFRLNGHRWSWTLWRVADFSFSLPL